MGCFYDVRQDVFARISDVDNIHLSARNHDFAHLHFRNLHHAFDHRQCIGIEQIVFVSGLCNSSSNSSRLSGSRESQEVSRSRKLGRGKCVSSIVSECCPGRGIRVSIAQAQHDKTFYRFHCYRFGIGLVIIALQMQHATKVRCA